MKTKIVKNLCLLCGCLSILSTSLTGCVSSGGNKEEDNTDVWGTYSTAKVTQNVKEEVPYKKLSAEVNIQMMKNETEGSQIVVTAGDKAVSSYSLELNDLSDGNGNVISKKAINAYHQKYLHVAHEADPLNTYYAAGDSVPDMLLPLETAIQYGENKIAKGCNQGITIEVTTDDTTVAGKYTGNFVLDIDGKKQNIPVQVEVWDIEYQGKRTFQSSFLLYRNTLISGEYEASDELVERYIEYLLKYKVNTYVIKDTYNVEEFVEEVKKLYDENNFNSLCIPKIMQAGYMANNAQANEIVEYITAVAKVSTPEKPYINMLYIYPTYFDEADMFAEKHQDVVNVFKKGGEWDKTLEKALASVKNTNEYQAFSAEFKQQIEEAILNIPAVFTNTNFREDWVADSHVTFCPYISQFSSGATLEKYKEAATENNNGNLWAYTCVGPKYPNPTFHVDDFNLGTRLTGWMAKKFGVNGYLYWAVNMYQAINEDPWRDVDVYETSERAGYCGGDGFLLYPGAYYGSEYPFASNRLTAWRDAMDDYDMLEVYENLVNEKAKAYGVEVDFDELVGDLYDSLFVGTSYYTEDELVVNARAELASRILALSGKDGLIVEDGKSAVNVYSTNNTLKVNGADQTGVASGSGYKFTINKTDATLLNIKTADAEYNFNTDSLTSVSLQNAVVTDDSEVSYADNQSTVKITSIYKSDDESIDGATSRFNPYVQYTATGLENATAIDLAINNTGAEDVEFTLRLIKADGTAMNVDTVYVKAGTERVIHVTLNKNVFTQEVLANINGIRLSFKNVNNNNTALCAERNFIVTNIWVEK